MGRNACISLEACDGLMLFRNIVRMSRVRALAVVHDDRLNTNERLASLALDVQQRQCGVLHHAPIEGKPAWPLIRNCDILILHPSAGQDDAVEMDKVPADS